MEGIIKEFYARINIFNVKVENGTFGKWKDKQFAVTYTKNNVDYFTEFFTTQNVEAMAKTLN